LNLESDLAGDFADDLQRDRAGGGPGDEGAGLAAVGPDVADALVAGA
jgi:hypothetical protein